MSQNIKLKLTLLFICTFTIAKCTKSLPLLSSEDEVDIPDEKYLIDLTMFGEKIYGHPDVKTGDLVSSFVETDGNPEEMGSYLEGDILIPNDNQTERNGILAKSYRWPNAVVPFEIRGTFSLRDLSIIQYALNEYHTKTCVRFRPRTREKNYVSITNTKTGCWASVGCIGGRQQVNLQAPTCLMTYGTAIHELMHALGFFHEQNRPERDEYVRVLRENVKPGKMQNFAKSSSTKVYGFGVPYDYASVMHYSSRSFSRNGKPTLLALFNRTESRMMGQRYGFSASDIAKINAMYQCKDRNQEMALK